MSAEPLRTAWPGVLMVPFLRISCSAPGRSGAAWTGSSRCCIVDRGRSGDPERFFKGYTLSLLRPAAGAGASRMEILERVLVESFERSEGRLFLSRPLSVDPEEGMFYELSSGEEAPVTGIRWLKGLRLEETVGAVEVRLGTTRGTNALLERRGAAVAFVTTAGFGDMLEIGYQDRPRLFDLRIKKPSRLYREVVELNERTGSRGEILVSLDEDEVYDKLAPLLERGIQSLAVCLLNSHLNGKHEEMVAEAARRLGFRHVSYSAALMPLQKIVARSETTVIDAYLTPVVRDYVQELRSSLPVARIKIMTSAGGLVDASSFVGKDSILSGPAGGVVGFAHAAEQAGFPRAIGFDMGGTSTDVSRYDGDYEHRFEMEIQDPASDGGVHLVSPMLWIETVAAGGGSVCWFDGQLPRVGPHSAGADPGPACYGRGGPLTVTDVNLFLGRVLAEHFAFPLDVDAVADRLDEIAARVESSGKRYTREELAAGFARIANSRVAAAIRKISLARGYDPREYALAAFGGAGAQHACAVAGELGIKRVLLHPYGSILSAFGIGMADVKRFYSQAVGRPYDKRELQLLEPLFKRMEAGLVEEVSAEGVPPERMETPRRMLEMRYAGQEWTLTVSRPADGDYRRAFEEQHQKRYGFLYPDRPLEIHAARVEITGKTVKPEPVPGEVYRRRPLAAVKTRIYAGNDWCEAAVFYRHELSPGDLLEGPAVIVDAGTTIVVDPGWEAEISAINNIILRDRPGETAAGESAGEELDLITLELFNNAFSAIAEQMGATLQKTALSTNVKERLDFSCAVFSAEGELVANAPHIPVHLGAMPASVKYIINSFPQMRPGEVYITNDPYRGGSHLPDITVVTPVFGGSGGKPLFFTASRAHHAEIGGITPGSMPPFARSLAEEGVLIRAFRFVSDSRAGEKELEELLGGGRYPSRAVRDNIADIHAQVAANRTGAARLLELVQRYGLDVVRAYMSHIQDAAEKMMRSALLKIKEGQYSFIDYLDDGSPIKVKITLCHIHGGAIPGGEAVVDFSGSGGVVPGSLNANSAVVASAVLYCFRCLIEEDIPLNAGMLKPLRIIIPQNSLLSPPEDEDPEKCAPVAGGNVETSQRIVDVIFGALGAAAASQGTMNNFSFGRAAAEGRTAVTCYETIGGGAGAGNGFHGADAVHTHMTNTRLTDPEVLEARYPVRISRFAVRRGSGGRGKYCGGDGIVREMEFLEPLLVSLLTGRRVYPPYGLAAGEPGMKGRNLLRRAGSSTLEELGWAASLSVDSGDTVIIETPGGGGYGRSISYF